MASDPTPLPSDASPEPTASPIERPIAIAVTAIAFLTLGATLLAGVFVLATNAGGRMVTVPLVPAEGRHPELGLAPADAWTTYEAVRVMASDPPLASRALRLAGYGLYGVLIIAGCLIAIALCRRVVRGRPFVRGAAAALGSLGLMCVVVALATPALLLEGDYLAVADLGLRMYDPDSESYLDAGSPAASEALWPDRFDRFAVVLTSTNWLLAGVGGILVVVALAFRRGLSLQRDTEGLV